MNFSFAVFESNMRLQRARFLCSLTDEVFIRRGDEDGIKGFFFLTPHRCSSACLEYQ